MGLVLLFTLLIANGFLCWVEGHVIHSKDESTLNAFQEKIIGGVDATPGDLPWQVSIQQLYYRPTFPSKHPPPTWHSCGGSIVDSTHIVTAAHCATSDVLDIIVIAGAHNISRFSKEPWQQRTGVKRKKIHPKYSKITFENDIAVLTLLEPLKFTERVQPIRLAPIGHEPSGSCVASGWGNDNNTAPRTPQIFQRITLDVVPRIPCKKKLPGVRASMVCAGASGKERGTCMGDSGGPLTCYDLGDRKPYLAGAVSWGKTGDCGQLGFPSVFANIGNLRAFLDAEIKLP